MLKWAARTVGMAMLVLVPVLAAQVGLGSLVESRPEVAWLTAAAFGVVVLVLTAPGVILAAALPATYLYYRVGSASADMSLADVTLGVAILAALPFVPWRSPKLRSMLKVLGVYLLVLAIAVVAVPSQRALAEWAHRAFLVAGGLFVGAAIVTTGRVTHALRAYVVASVIVSIAAIADAISHMSAGSIPDPAYPFGMQKNPAGFLLACALIVMIAAARHVSIPRPVGVVCIVLLVLGVLASQARGAAIALVIVLALRVVRERNVRVSFLLVVGGLLLLGMAYVTLNATFQSDAEDSRFNSVNSRVATYDAAIALWRRDPLVGVGLKFWRDRAFFGETAFGEPHDLAVSALGESGVVGLAALGVLVLGTLVVVVKSPSRFASLAVLVVVAKTTASVVDIYWVAGTLTFMWIMVGCACAPDPPERTSSVDREEQLSGVNR